MKPVDVKSNTWLILVKKWDDRDPKFKVGDIIKRLRCFCNSLHFKLVWRSFAIKNVKNTVPWTYVINHINEENVFGTLYKKELEKNKSKSI